MTRLSGDGSQLRVTLVRWGPKNGKIESGRKMNSRTGDREKRGELSIATKRSNVRAHLRRRLPFARVPSSGATPFRQRASSLGGPPWFCRTAAAQSVLHRQV